MTNEKRLIEIPDDGIISISIMRGDDAVGERRIDLSFLPTVDAVEVIHSTWRLNKDGSGTCQHCHRTTKNVWDYDSWFRYCPDCGARMDGEPTCWNN